MDLIDAVREVTERVLQDSTVVPDSMLTSTQMHTAVLTDLADTPVSPMISWQDNRLLERGDTGRTHIDELLERGAEVWATSGIAHRPGVGAGNLGVWRRENRSSVPTPGRIHSVGSFIATSLGAPFSTHLTNAAALGLVDVRERRWSPALQELHGLAGWQLPELRHEHTAHGNVLLGGIELRWLGDMADHQASVMGAGGLRADGVAISLGTAGIAARLGTAPSTDQRVDSRPFGEGEFLLTVSRQPGGAVAGLFARTLADLASDLSGAHVDPQALWQLTESMSERKPTAAWVRFGTTGEGDPELSFGGLQAVGDPIRELYSAFVRAYVDAYQESIDILFAAGESPSSVQFNGGFAANNGTFRRALSAGLGLASVEVPEGDLALEGLKKLVIRSDQMEGVRQ